MAFTVEAETSGEFRKHCRSFVAWRENFKKIKSVDINFLLQNAVMYKNNSQFY